MTTKRNYAILRAVKLHTRQALQGAQDHNNRATKKGTEHADPDGAAGLIAGDRNTVAAWDAQMAAAGLDPKKQRKGAILALEWVATASPAWWATRTPEQREEWGADTMAFIQEQAGGKARVLSAWWHQDEATPHIHVVTIPLVEKERKALGRTRKGRVAPPATKGWGLAAKDIIGGSSHRMVELQSDYAAAVAHHGLVRGTPRKETGERNKSPAQWRAEQARLTDEMAADHNGRRKARGMMAQAEKTMAQAVAALDYAQGLGAVVREDAKRLARSIHFPAYAEDPKHTDAREAVQKAAAQRERDAEREKARRLREERMSLRSASQAQQGGQGRGAR